MRSLNEFVTSLSKHDRRRLMIVVLSDLTVALRGLLFDDNALLDQQRGKLKAANEVLHKIAGYLLAQERNEDFLPAHIAAILEEAVSTDLVSVERISNVQF